MDDDQEEEVEELEAEVVGTNPKTITTKEVKEFSIDDLKKENELLKEKLAKSPADSPIKVEKFTDAKVSRILSKNERNNLNSSDKFLYDLNN